MKSENPLVTIAYIEKRIENSNLSTHAGEFVLPKSGVSFKEVIGESLHGNKKIIGKKRRF